AQSRPMAFLTVDELRDLPGMTGALFERAAPFITVYSESASVDPDVAAAAVLLSLPGAKPAEIQTRLAARLQSWQPGAAPTGGGGDLQVFTVRSAGTTANGTTFIREAVIRLTGERAQPYRLLAWRKGETRRALLASN